MIAPAQFPVAEMRGDDDHAFAVGAGLGQVIEISMSTSRRTSSGRIQATRKNQPVLAEVFEIRHAPRASSFRRNGLASAHDLTRFAPDCARHTRSHKQKQSAMRMPSQ